MEERSTVSLESSNSSNVTFMAGNDSEDKCIQINSPGLIASIPLKAVGIVLNGTLLVAACIARKKLKRQNYTNDCVISTLVSNLLLLIMSVWLVVDHLLQPLQGSDENTMSNEKYLWLLTEALTASLLLGITSSASSLIFVSFDSVVYVSRKGAEWGRTGGKEKNAKKTKALIARVLVIISWVLPALLIVISLIWNCAKECRCISNTFKGGHCPKELKCSQTWAPLKKNYLYMVSAIWLVQMLTLLIFFTIMLRRHRRLGARLNSKFKFATYLTILLIFCTIPMNITTLADSTMENPPNDTMLIISGLLMFIYTAGCPILIVKYFPPLRSALVTCLKRRGQVNQE